MDYSYASECLYQAIRVLCGDGARDQRLRDAIAFHIQNIRPECDLPEDIRADFWEFRSFAYDVGGLREEDLTQAIDMVIALFDRLCRDQELA
ncbi:hypothetical protein GCM10007094_25350 [Pseudovibrio japonicus]|uniref:HEPN domain-containing protein n=1 Tax=Pseudovibrio japonicus TaxID=366534 RepID=A0ABQ3ELV6_9HYPH|nr:hypothetical protein [Pseudovibrio japonicus]GHB34847.1 hypothetical protein GCM10007094_25350 [Pseudovibrio japonicus]